MDTPSLAGKYFEGASWTNWRVFIKALFGLPMTDDDLPIYRTYTGRTTPPDSQFTEAELVIGRRGGKSRILATIAVFLANQRDYRPFLAPGEIATIGVLASDRKQARAIFRYAEGLIDAIPALAAEVTKRTDEIIELGRLRVAIEIGTASFRATRGYTYCAVLADEVAFWRSDESANPDAEILAAIRPGLMTIPGSMLLIASSPYAKRGELYRLYKKHYGKNDAPVLVWQASTRDMNPEIPEAWIAEKYEEDPERAKAEFGALFRNDVAAFITPEVIEACTIPGRFELPYLSANQYRAFVDPSGGSSDSFTLAIVHEEADIAVLDCVREIKAPFSPDAATKEMADTIKAYGLKSVTGDRYGGEWPRERFRVHGIDYLLSEKDRSGLYLEALPRLNAGKVELLDLKQIERQFCGLERRTARSGKDSVDHAPGSHDDVVNAIAGAIVMDAKPAMPVFTAADLALI